MVTTILLQLTELATCRQLCFQTHRWSKLSAVFATAQAGANVRHLAVSECRFASPMTMTTASRCTNADFALSGRAESTTADSYVYTGWPKKTGTFLYASSDIDQFSNFFHCQNQGSVVTHLRCGGIFSDSTISRYRPTIHNGVLIFTPRRVLGYCKL